MYPERLLVCPTALLRQVSSLTTRAASTLSSAPSRTRIRPLGSTLWESTRMYQVTRRCRQQQLLRHRCPSMVTTTTRSVTPPPLEPPQIPLLFIQAKKVVRDTRLPLSGSRHSARRQISCACPISLTISWLQPHPPPAARHCQPKAQWRTMSATTNGTQRPSELNGGVRIEQDSILTNFPATLLPSTICTTGCGPQTRIPLTPARSEAQVVDSSLAHLERIASAVSRRRIYH